MRVVHDRDKLSPILHGLKGPDLFGGVYVSRVLLAAWREGTKRDGMGDAKLEFRHG